MFNVLDDTLRNLLDSAPANTANNLFLSAEISFDTPAKGFTPKQGDLAINLFLYEVKENRELRQPMPTREVATGRGVRRRAPLRVDCSYMVTAWSNITNQDNVANAHRLLGQAFHWLSRFPTIPERYFPQPNLPADPGMPYQPFAPPTMVAQMDGAKGAGEFWSALGIPPRPYFNLIVTICLDLDQAVGDSIVTTVSSRYYQAGIAASGEERLMIGGTVRDTGGNPVADAWVRLEPPNPLVPSQIRVTDAAGHFIFEDVARGAGYTLRARAQGHPEHQVPDVEVPSLSGEYDVVV
jgi:uncharacterized protein DUF4255/carboxypeptidase family protein